MSKATVQMPSDITMVPGGKRVVFELPFRLTEEMRERLDMIDGVQCILAERYRLTVLIGYAFDSQEVMGRVHRYLQSFEIAESKSSILISAAPDLLAALEAAISLYGTPGGPWNVPSDPGGWLEQARAAVAKAKSAA